MGILLSLADGRPLGIIALLHRGEIADSRRAETYLRIVAARAAAELDRERTQAATSDERKAPANILDHAQDALFLHDAQGRVIDVNQQACDGLGFTRDELLGVMPDKFDPVPASCWSIGSMNVSKPARLSRSIQGIQRQRRFPVPGRGADSALLARGATFRVIDRPRHQRAEGERSCTRGNAKSHDSNA